MYANIERFQCQPTLPSKLIKINELHPNAPSVFRAHKTRKAIVATATTLIGGGKIVTLPMILIGFQRSSDEAVTAMLTLVFLAPTILFLAFAARLWRDS